MLKRLKEPKPKAYRAGMMKQIAPAKTNRRVLKILKKFKPSLVRHVVKIYRSSDIPQYQIIGTEIYHKTVGAFAANGKGHIMEQALASGLMELVERFSCFSYLSRPDNFIVASATELKNRPHLAVEDVLSSFLYSGHQVPASLLRTSRIRWYRGQNTAGKEVLLPFGLIMFMLEGTNGMAAGNTPDEALLQSYCEIIERHCLSLISDRAPRPSIDPSTVDSRICRELLAKFDRLGHQVILKDLSNGFGIPVIGVLRIADNRAFLTAGVASSREEALLRSLTENSQSDSLRKFRPMDTFEFLLRHPNTLSYKEVTQIEKGYFYKEVRALQNLFRKQGMEPYHMDATHPGLKIASVIAYVKGAKYYKPSVANKNTILGLATESVALNLSEQAAAVIRYGLDHDKQNNKLYASLLSYMNRGV